jgi:hypothetical protein
MRYKRKKLSLEEEFLRDKLIAVSSKLTFVDWRKIRDEDYWRTADALRRNRDEKSRARFMIKRISEYLKIETKPMNQSKFTLPLRYMEISQPVRRLVRMQYIEEQNGLCYYCGCNINEQPPENITNKQINHELFPENFLKYPIHLRRNKDTDLTEGAVHAYCNAVLWQYERR